MKDTAELPDNFQAAMGVLKSTEKTDMYQDQIQDMIDRGVVHKHSGSKIREYDGPIHCISHHELLKPDSTSTPCRIVFNSSVKVSWSLP